MKAQGFTFSTNWE